MTLDTVDSSPPKYHADRVPKATPQGSIYKPDAEAMSTVDPEVVNADIFRSVAFNTEENSYSPLDEQNRYAHPEFRALMNTLFYQYKPTNHPFFANLKNAPTAVVKSEPFLSELYKRYQAGMHATRAAVWFTPNLDTPRLRQRKACIIVDDDTTDSTKTHHQQLEALFRYLGAASPMDENSFGSLDTLKEHLDSETYAFCAKAWELYTAGTGAWSIFEVLSDNWQSGLAASLGAHYGPALLKQQYFDEIAFGHIEILHMLETVSLTEDVLHRKPHLLAATMEEAKEMAAWSWKLWDNLDALLQTHIRAAGCPTGAAR